MSTPTFHLQLAAHLPFPGYFGFCLFIASDSFHLDQEGKIWWGLGLDGAQDPFQEHLEENKGVGWALQEVQLRLPTALVGTSALALVPTPSHFPDSGNTEGGLR